MRRQVQLIEARQEKDKVEIDMLQKQFQKVTYADSPVGAESKKQNSKILDTILANAKSMNDNYLLLKKML